MKKSERLIFLLNLLGGGSSFSVDDLAGKCEVSVRTIYRDINDLSFHCTIYYDDGYRLIDIKETVVSPFNRMELLAMKLAVKLPPIVESPYYADAVRSASKRIDDLLADYDGQFDSLPGSIDISIDSTPLDKKTLGLFGQFERAIEGRRLLRARYVSVTSGETDRIIAPIGMVFRRHNWYLVAFCYTRRDNRLFRINRFIEAEETGEIYKREIPDLNRFFENAWEMAVSGKTYDISLLFKPRLVALVESSYAHRGNIKRLPNGKLRFTTRVKELFEIKNWVMRFGAGVEVEKPPELVESIESEIKAMNKLYGINNG